MGLVNIFNTYSIYQRCNISHSKYHLFDISNMQYITHSKYQICNISPIQIHQICNISHIQYIKHAIYQIYFRYILFPSWFKFHSTSNCLTYFYRYTSFHREGEQLYDSKIQSRNNLNRGWLTTSWRYNNAVIRRELHVFEEWNRPSSVVGIHEFIFMSSWWFFFSWVCQIDWSFVSLLVYYTLH